MILFLVLFGVGAVVLPLLARVLKRRVFLLAALIPVAAFVHDVVVIPALADGEVLTETVRWVPQLGLELAFCRMVAEAHGGHIYAGNNPDRGAVLTIEM